MSFIEVEVESERQLQSLIVKSQSDNIQNESKVQIQFNSNNLYNNPTKSELLWAKLSFLLLGLGVLVPWNAVLNSIPFFKKCYPEHKNISFLLTIPSLASTFVFGAFVMIRSEFLSLRFKLIFSNLINIIILVMQPL